MSYKVIIEFADIDDFDHVYKVGDEYPRNGYQPNEARLKKLLGVSNALGKPIIELVKDAEEVPLVKEATTKNNKKK